MEQETEGLSIGALSKATGISIHSLRMWERRYGAPQSLRRNSGHRRYPYEEVPRLRAVGRAIALGFRAGEVAALSLVDLQGKLDNLDAQSGVLHPGDPAGSGSSIERLHQLVVAARDFNEHLLDREFLDGWNLLGPLHFLSHIAIPYMAELGDCWQSGCVDIANEHFASEKLCDFLSARWRSLNREATRAPYIIAGLPRDRHRVALLLAAIVVSSAEHRVLFIGGETPVADLASACRTSEAAGVCLPISASVSEAFAKRYLTELSEKVPGNVAIVTGGAGAPPPTGRVQRLPDFIDLYHWLRGRQEEAAGHAPTRAGKLLG